MTWVQEWKSMLQTKAQSSTHSTTVDLELYDALRIYCLFHDIIFFPSMYDEYMVWNATQHSSDEPTDQHLAQYADQSVLIQKQLQEIAFIRQLETFAKKARLRFYDGDSVMEKVALAAHYFGLRGRG